MMQRHLQLGLAFDLDLDRFVVKMNVGALGHDEERIQHLFHDFLSPHFGKGGPGGI